MHRSPFGLRTPKDSNAFAGIYFAARSADLAFTGHRAQRPSSMNLVVKDLKRVRRQHERDLSRGAGFVELPFALSEKYPNAAKEWGWQWVFPATRHLLH